MSSEPDSTEFSLPLPALERIDKRCLEFEAAWKAGEAPRIEDYLGDAQGAERGELLRQLLLLDLDYRSHQADQPTVEEYRGRFSDDGEIVANAFGEFSMGTASSPPPGTRVRYFGDYELLEEIGHGGMGVVYKARQVSLNRVVALKMILSVRLTSQAAVNRFRAEAETAANLQHPNIVAVHEVGVHNGQQYFSMDYVDGQNLAEMVRENSLPAHRAAQYIRKIAEAIHYAHEQGTLHRDLKPSNVLIDAHDEPRVTDFGLAKRMESDHELTGSSEILGTPSYMAPEQAEGQHERIGAASDVYSMGAVLYELLTGRPPFRAATPVETLRLVIDTEPVSPRLLNPQVPRDLETVCLKCLEKDPNRRYTAARALADDLHRFLDDKPIEARPVTHAEKMLRWCKRNPVASTLSTALVLVLIGGLLVVTQLWIVANGEAAKAAAEARRANSVVGLLQQMLASANPENGAPATLTVRELLDSFTEDIAGQLQEEPEVEATVRSTIGRAYWRLNRLTEARVHLGRAVELRRRQSLEDPSLLAKSLVDLAWVMWEQRDLAAAQEVLQEAQTIYSNSGRAPQDALEAIRVLQLVAIEQGQNAESDRLVEQAREIVRSLPGQKDMQFAAMLQSQSANRLDRGQATEAEQLARQSVAMFRDTTPATHPEMAYGLLVLGRALAALERPAEAETYLREALSIFRKYFPEDDIWGSYTTFSEMVRVLRAQGKNEDAANFLEEMADRLKKQQPSDENSRDCDDWLLWAERMEACEQWKPAREGYSKAAGVVKNPDWSVSFRLGHGFFVVGLNLDARGMASDSEIAQMFEHCIGHFQRALAQMPKGTDADNAKNDLAGAHANLSVTLEKLAEYDRAVVARKEAVRIWGELSKSEPSARVVPA